MDAMFTPLLDRPGDPAVLRVLSDALLEKGDPWGEAIRLALDLENTFPGEDAHRIGHRRLARLEQTHGAKWRAKVRKPQQGPIRAYVRMFRAIPSRIDSTDSSVAKLLEGPVAWLDFNARTTALVPSWPRRAGLVRIDVMYNVDAKQLHALLGPGLSSLTQVALPWLGAPTLELLESVDWLPQLEALRLFGNEAAMSPLDLDRLLKLSMPKLRELDLRGIALGQPGAERLATIPWKLERLTLDDANFGVKGTVAFVASPSLATVKELKLTHNTMGPNGAAALATSPHLKQLIALDLSSTASGAKTLATFFESCALPSLKALTLNSCGLKGAGLEPLGKSKNKALSKLTRLDVSGNLMGDDGLANLSKTTVLTNVRELYLGGNAIKGNGMDALGKSVLLDKVETLTLGHNKFQNTGAKGLAASKKLGSLKELTLGHNWLGVQGLKAILKNPTLTHFEQLNEGMNNYGPELVRSFIDSKTLKLWMLSLGPETTTDALNALLSSVRVASLEFLSLSCGAFDDEQAEVLVKGPLAKAITSLSVSRAWCAKLSDAGAQKLTSVLGERVTFD